MPTPPFSSSLQDQLTDATAWKFSSELGPIFTPRFFCCVSPKTLGITDGKEPVAVIELTAIRYPVLVRKRSAAGREPLRAGPGNI